MNDQLDIIIIELSVNDYGYLYGKTAKPMELLTRQVLSLPSFPLVLYVSLVDVLLKRGKHNKSIQNPYCHNLEDLGQRELAEYYEITLLSWRDIICLINPRTKRQQAYLRPGMVNRDHLHIDKIGHTQVALMMVRYFQNTIQSASSIAALGPQPKCKDIGLIPPLFANASLLVTNPLCWAYANPRWGMSAVNQTLHVRVKRKRKVEEVKVESVMARKAKSDEDRTDAFGGWRSSRQGSFLEFSFQVPAGQNTSLNSRSIGIVTRRVRLNAGHVKMSLDNIKKDTVDIKALGRYHETRIFFVASHVPPGYHTITIETKGKKNHWAFNQRYRSWSSGY